VNKPQAVIHTPDAAHSRSVPVAWAIVAGLIIGLLSLWVL
jgi:hypothetical protein